MKQRKWSREWMVSVLEDAQVPFNPPAHMGQVIYLRSCDLGLAAFTYGEDAWINYIVEGEVEEGFFPKPAPYKGAVELTEVFELTRQEFLTTASELPQTLLYGEVPVPRDCPKEFGGAAVHVADGISWVREKVWFGEHYWDDKGNPHIVLQKQVLYAAMAMKDEDFIKKTLEHETFERRRKFSYMTADYGQVDPDKYQWLCDQFDGIAHVETVHHVEGFKSLTAYGRFLADWAAKAKLPNPAPRDEE